jgi:RecA/RadA recombinase
MATKKTSKKTTKKVTKKAASKSSTSKTTKGPPKVAAKKEAPKKLTKRQAEKARAEKQSGKGGAGDVRSWAATVSKMPKFKGLAQISFADELNTPYYLRRPTGVLGLDVALAGGFHAGGSAQIHGGESVGKTHLAFRTAGMVQKHYGDRAAILIVSTEIRPDKTFARKACFRFPYTKEEVDHFDTKRTERGLPPFTVEEKVDLTKKVGEIVVVTAGTGEKALDVAYEALVTGFFQLVIIESLGALLSSDQEAGDVGDRTYGGSSVMLTSFMNKVYPLYMMDRTAEDGSKSMLETTILGINQARAEMGAVGHQKKTHAAAGAFAWKHAQLASVELTKSKPYREGNAMLGREVRWEITKGKAGTHDGKKGTYNYWHVPKDDPVLWSDVELHSSTYGIDTITDMVVTAKQLGALDVSGSWLTWKEDGNVLIRAQSAEKFGEALVDDEELQNRLRFRCYELAELPVRVS